MNFKILNYFNNFKYRRNFMIILDELRDSEAPVASDIDIRNRFAWYLPEEYIYACCGHEPSMIKVVNFLLAAYPDEDHRTLVFSRALSWISHTQRFFYTADACLLVDESMKTYSHYINKVRLARRMVSVGT